tara:strand:+ start:5608 stop:6240 length:633 start_codon:yes stop_codon:yes gene_type:complete
MRFSKFISYVFHPVFIPLIILFILFYFTPIIANSTSNNICVNSIYTLFILVYTILPVLTSVVLVKFRLIGSFEMHDNRDRIVPLITNIIYMILGGIINSSCLNIFPFVKLIFLAIFIITICALVISFFWKISLHMLAAGNMLAVFVSSNFLIEPNLFLVFISLVFALIIAFSRYSEGSHTIPQLILGMVIGFCAQVFLVLNQSSIITSII